MLCVIYHNKKKAKIPKGKLGKKSGFPPESIHKKEKVEFQSSHPVGSWQKRIKEGNRKVQK